MHLTDRTALVTGATRGLGRHLVDGLLARGARRVYVTGRDPEATGRVVAGDDRLVGVTVDVTDAASVRAAAAQASDVDLLVNNAGVLSFGGPLDTDADAFRRDFETNVVGVVHTAQAFADVLAANRGALVNVVTLIALAPVVPMTPYCTSKAAVHSLTQSLRSALRSRGVTVHGVYPAGIDTDMLADVDEPKEPPAAVATAVLDGLERDVEDIVPAFAADAHAVYVSDPKALERMLAA